MTIQVKRRYNFDEWEPIAEYRDGEFEGDDDFLDAFGHLEGRDGEAILERFDGPNLLAMRPESDESGSEDDGGGDEPLADEIAESAAKSLSEKLGSGAAGTGSATYGGAGDDESLPEQCRSCGENDRMEGSMVCEECAEDGVEKEWVSDPTPEAPNRWTNTETGEYRYQEGKPGSGGGLGEDETEGGDRDFALTSQEEDELETLTECHGERGRGHEDCIKLSDNFEHIGGGDDRAAYKNDSGHILKVAKGKEMGLPGPHGTEVNKRAVESWNRVKGTDAEEYVLPVVESAEDNSWIVQNEATFDVSEEEADEVRSKIKEAGFTPLDSSAKNFARTPEGDVVFADLGDGIVESNKSKSENPYSFVEENGGVSKEREYVNNVHEAPDDAVVRTDEDDNLYYEKSLPAWEVLERRRQQSLEKSEGFERIDDELMKFYTHVVWWGLEEQEEGTLDLSKAPEMWQSSEEVPEFVEEYIREAIQDDAFWQGRFDELPAGAGQHVQSMFEEKMTQPQGWSLGSVIDDLEETYSNVDKDYLLMLTRNEVAAVANKAREEAYEDAEKEGETFEYYWSGPEDFRTTDVCSELKEETHPRFDGSPRPLGELKELMEDIAQKHPEGKTQRLDEWVPHFQCRHTFVRKVYL